jgi:hypothetical protein
LAQAIKLLGVTVQRIGPLPKGQQLPHLSIHLTLGYVVALEGLIEIIPSLHGLEMIPPH